MDYDKTAMPELYDKGRGYLPATQALWRKKIAQAAQGHSLKTIVDLGCGTGRYSEILANIFDAQIIGVDPSEKMLAQARQKTLANVVFQHASAEVLPLDDASADMVFMSMVLHHIENKEQAIAECYRILRPGGLFLLRAGTIEQIPNYPYIPFFPSSAALMKPRFHTKDNTISLFEMSGLSLISHEIIISDVTEDWDRFAERTALRADSILTLIDDNEFVEGVRGLRDYASRQHHKGPVSEPVDFFVFGKSSSI